MKKFAAIGARRVADERQPVFVLDHDIQNTSPENLAKYAKMATSAVDYDIHSHTFRQPDPGNSIDHGGVETMPNACNLCHLNGEAGAPRIGDQANWQERVQARGLPTLYRHANDGYNKMPPRGACITCSADDVVAGVDYLLYHSLGSSAWRELKNPAPAPRMASTSLDTGRAVYRSACATCHDAGKLGAPTLGDERQWAPLVHSNFEDLVKSTLDGVNGMPPRGGCTHCTGSEIVAAVKYMLQSARPGYDYSLW